MQRAKSVRCDPMARPMTGRVFALVLRAACFVHLNVGQTASARDAERKLCIEWDGSAPKTRAHTCTRAYGSDIGAKPRVKCSRMKTFRNIVRPVQGQRDSTLAQCIHGTLFTAGITLFYHYLTPFRSPDSCRYSIFDLVSLRHFSLHRRRYHCELSGRPHSLITCCSVFRTIKLFGHQFFDYTPRPDVSQSTRLSIELFNYQPTILIAARKRRRDDRPAGARAFGLTAAHELPDRRSPATAATAAATFKISI